MIIGTAGHIDHGKTTLVRALTGIDTDRLKEEKARGISIELGYAYSLLDDGEMLGFVDVPGHERLVHTMVAGSCGIDFALLAIAADDGIMPQTLEHLAILQLLGISQGAVILTKTDRVDSARLDQVRAQINTTLQGTILSGAPVFAVNATASDDSGVADLRRFLHDTAQQSPQRSDARLFRFAIDRVFTLIGHGTIATGTVFSGEVRMGDSVTIMPSGISVRIRSIHAHSRAASVARAGQRCALNLVGVDTSALSRGDWLADSRIFVPTTRIDVRLQLLANSRNAFRLASWAPVHVHLGTAHQVAHVVPLESTELRTGVSSRAQIVFARPVCATPGDRFILRDAGALRTIGGGVVLDPLGPARKRRSPERARRLDALEKLAGGEGIAPLLEHSPYGVSLRELTRLTGYPPERIALPPETLSIEAGPERLIILRSHWDALRERITTALRAFHMQVPDEPGPDIGRLRRMAAPELTDGLWRACIAQLVSERQIIRDGPWLHVPEHAAALSEEDQILVNKLQTLIAHGRFNPPWVRDLAAASREPEERVRTILRKSVAQGLVYQVIRDLFYDRASISELASIIARLARENGAVDAAQYRDALGLGRKRTVQILEFFDRVGYTRRVRDSHMLRPDSGWPL